MEGIDELANLLNYLIQKSGKEKKRKKRILLEEALDKIKQANALD